MPLLAFMLIGHSNRWWLYVLAYALLAITIVSVIFEMAQGASLRLSRTRLWIGSLGAVLFALVAMTEPSTARPVNLASFATGVLVCTLLFFGWLGLQRRRR